jgi:hypothetical protein
MPEALSVTEQVYSGETTQFFLTRPVVEMDTYEKGCISLIDGIKKQHTIDRMEVSNFIQDPAATPVSNGLIMVDVGMQLIPKRFDLYMEFNPHDFEVSFFAPELQKLLMDRGLPPTANNFLLLQLMRRVNQYYEFSIWQQAIKYNPSGLNVPTPAALTTATKNTNFYYFDGLIEKALADPNTIQVAGAVALTFTNIRAQFEAAMELVPQAMIGKYGADGVKILVSNVDWLKYNRALREDAFKNQNSTDESQDKWNGYQVERLAGLPEHCFFMTVANPNPLTSQTFIGLNEFTDKDNLKLMPVSNPSDLWFIKSEQKADVNWGITDQVVMYNGAGLTA